MGLMQAARGGKWRPAVWKGEALGLALGVQYKGSFPHPIHSTLTSSGALATHFILPTLLLPRPSAPHTSARHTNRPWRWGVASSSTPARRVAPVVWAPACELPLANEQLGH